MTDQTKALVLEFGRPVRVWRAPHRNVSERSLTVAEMTQSFVTQAHPAGVTTHLNNNWSAQCMSCGQLNRLETVLPR